MHAVDNDYLLEFVVRHPRVLRVGIPVLEIWSIRMLRHMAGQHHHTYLLFRRAPSAYLMTATSIRAVRLLIKMLATLATSPKSIAPGKSAASVSA